MNRAIKHFRFARTTAIKNSKFAPPMRAWPLGIVLAAGFILVCYSITITAKRRCRYHASHIAFFARYATHSQSHNRMCNTDRRTRQVGLDRHMLKH